MDSIKGRAKNGLGKAFVKVVDVTEQGARGVDYAVKNPGKATKKTTQKIVVDGAYKPVKGLLLTGAHFLKEGATQTLPWVAKKTVAGGKVAFKGTANAARRMDERTVHFEKDDTAARAANSLVEHNGTHVFAHTGTVETLRAGLEAAMQLHSVIEANERSVKISWSNVAVHVGSTFLVKGAKVALFTAVMHVPGMQHVPLAHLLNEQDHITKWFHINSGAAEGAIGMGLAKVGEHKFSDSLAKSNVEAYDMEMWARSGAEAKNKDAIEKMKDAMDSLNGIVGAKQGTQDVKITHADIEYVRAGILAAREMAAFAGSEEFQSIVGDLDVSNAGARADKLMSNYHLQASGLGDRTVPNEIIKEPKGKEVVDERTKGYFERRRDRKLAKKEESAKAETVHDLKKAARAEKTRASKYNEKFYAADRELKHMDVDNAERARKHKPLYVNDHRNAERKDAQLRRDLAQAKRGLAEHKLGTLQAGQEPDEALVTRLETSIVDLEKQVAGQRGVLEKLLPFDDRMTWAGMKRAMNAQVEHFTNEMNKFDASIEKVAAEVAKFDDPENRDSGQKWRLEKSNLEQRIDKIKAKREIARLQVKLAESDLELGGLMKQNKSSDDMIAAALENRISHNEVETQLFTARVSYDEAAGIQHRSSVWVKKDAKFSDTGGSIVNGAAKFGWWSMALFPVTAIPYWGIRHLTTTVRDASYMSYMKATLNEEA